MQTCAVIACSHGLGHIRRCILIANQREALGFSVTLFAPLNSVTRLQYITSLSSSIEVCDFNTNTTIASFSGDIATCTSWLERLPSLDPYEIVICDNFPEILSLRPDAIISAQFFWHDAIPNCSKSYYQYCEDLLSAYNPTIIGCRIFAMSSVTHRPNFQPVDLYQIPELALAARQNHSRICSDLLITGGSTPIITGILKGYIEQLLNSPSPLFNTVHIDSQLMPSSPPSWMVKADFSHEMYLKLSHAVCRPGLGTLTDLITVESSIMPVYEPHNREMKHNHAMLMKYFPQRCFDLSIILKR